MQTALAQVPRVGPTRVVTPLDFSETRAAQVAWSEMPLRQRLAVVRKFRNRLASNGLCIAGLFSPSLRRTASDTLTAEVLPLAEAARFLELRAERLLRSTTLSKEGRPQWLRGVQIIVSHEPLGVVLVIAPANYPLLLPGVQVMQALVAGNAVIWKPGVGGRPVAEAMRSLLIEAGVPKALLLVTDESTAVAQQCIATGVDKVVLTGSAASGRSVLEQCAASAIPATVELSGCDAMFVLPGAEVNKAVRSLLFGLTLNGSATCIAPRRIFVHAGIAQEFETVLSAALKDTPEVAVDSAVAMHVAELIDDAAKHGGRTLRQSHCIYPIVVVNATPAMRLMQADIFAPIAGMMTVPSLHAAAEAANVCPYALGASIFGNIDEARTLAEQVHAGVVVINDMIVPTADPRLSFGGRKKSGFGKTRGSEGLLQMTVSKAIVVQRARRLRHLEPVHPQATELFDAYLRLRHGAGLANRIRAFASLCRAAMNKSRS